MIAVTLYLRSSIANVEADGVSYGQYLGVDKTQQLTIPNNTRLLSIYAGVRNSHEPGFLMKVNEYILGSQWKCIDHVSGGSWSRVTDSDEDWPRAVIYNWPWEEHDIEPAEFISAEDYGQRGNGVWCRGWVGEYIIIR